MGIPYTQRVGEKHNMLTILKITGKEYTGKRTKIRCLVRCDCGIEKDVRIEGVVNGQQYSCGCSRKKFRSPYRKKFTNYQNSAKDRGYSFELGESDFESIVSQNCNYCGCDTDVGIDRVDNTVGYVVSNCVPCCATCNRAKGTLSYDSFVSWIERLVEWQK